MKLVITHRIELVVLNVSDPLSLLFLAAVGISSEGHRIVVQRKNIGQRAFFGVGDENEFMVTPVLVTPVLKRS
ncbi:TPA: hypothetical protein ACU8CP_004916 [Escherichia coli]